jgi:intracellular sulfur oxidation DsrE/DsrF family protein
MKKVKLLAGLLLAGLLASSQSDYKVVFDLTSRDTLNQRAIIRWINEIKDNNPNAQMEVVLYGMGTDLVVKGKSPYEQTITQLANTKNVSFKICAIAMKNQHIDNSQLLPGVQTVPDGIYEIISRQRTGWGYIKAAH